MQRQAIPLCGIELELHPQFSTLSTQYQPDTPTALTTQAAKWITSQILNLPCKNQLN